MQCGVRFVRLFLAPASLSLVFMSLRGRYPGSGCKGGRGCICLRESACALVS